MTIKEQYAANFVLLADYRKGSLADQSPSGNDGAFVGDPVFANTDKGLALKGFSASDYVNYGNASDLKFTNEDFTLGFYVQNAQQVQCLPFGKGTSGTYSPYAFQLEYPSSGKFGIYMGNSAGNGWLIRPNELSADYDPEGSLIVCVKEGTDVTLYSNGVDGGSYTMASDTIMDNSLPFRVGVASNATQPLNKNGGITQGFAISGVALSGQEVAQLYEEVQQEAFILSIPTKTNIPKPYLTLDPVFPTPIFETDFKPRNNKLNDLSGNGNDADINGVIASEGSLGESMEFQGVADQDVSFGNSTMLHDLDTASFCFLLEPTAFGNFDGFLAQGTSITDRTRIGLGGVLGTNKDILINFANGGTAASAYTTNEPLAANAPVLIRIEFNGHQAENIKLYVNEEKQTLTESGTKASTLSNVSAELLLGNDLGAVGRVFNGHMYYAAIFDQNLTTAQGAALLAKMQEKLNLNLLQEDIIVTPSSVSSDYLSNTGFEVLSGSFDVVVDDEGDKAIECASDGVVAIPSSGVYGTWEWSMLQADTNNAPSVFFANQGAAVDSSDDGYRFFINTDEAFGLDKYVSTSSTVLLRSSNSYVTTGQWYKIRITRTPEGVFTVYHSTDNGVTWTQTDSSQDGSNPFTDTSITSSSHFVFDGDAGDQLKDVKYYPLVIDPTV